MAPWQLCETFIGSMGRLEGTWDPRPMIRVVRWVYDGARAIKVRPDESNGQDHVKQLRGMLAMMQTRHCLWKSYHQDQ